MPLNMLFLKYYYFEDFQIKLCQSLNFNCFPYNSMCLCVVSMPFERNCNLNGHTSKLYNSRVIKITAISQFHGFICILQIKILPQTLLYGLIMNVKTTTTKQWSQNNISSTGPCASPGQCTSSRAWGRCPPSCSPPAVRQSPRYAWSRPRSRPRWASARPPAGRHRAQSGCSVRGGTTDSSNSTAGHTIDQTRGESTGNSSAIHSAKIKSK